MERWVEHRRPGWEERSPGQPDATLARIRRHITPKVGDVAVERLRPLDVDNPPDARSVEDLTALLTSAGER